MRNLLVALLIGAFQKCLADVGPISGYPQVDVEELNPLTLSWNQVSLRATYMQQDEE